MYRSSVLERGRAGMGLAACSRTKASDTEPTRCAPDTDRSKPEPRPPQLTAGLTDDRHGDGPSTVTSAARWSREMISLMACSD
jgi:hypothetical protein